MEHKAILISSEFNVLVKHFKPKCASIINFRCLRVCTWIKPRYTCEGIQRFQILNSFKLSKLRYRLRKSKGQTPRGFSMRNLFLSRIISPFFKLRNCCRDFSNLLKCWWQECRILHKMTEEDTLFLMFSNELTYPGCL